MQSSVGKSMMKCKSNIHGRAHQRLKMGCNIIFPEKRLRVSHGSLYSRKRC